MNSFEIIGQSTLIRRLKSIMDSGRIVHSYIFTGPTGAGKKTISNYFAKMLQCQGMDKPCNTCKSCRQVESSNHPDIIRIESQSNVIRVDSIRELRKDISIKPFQSQRKIYIIEKGDTMNQQAQNALLKTLEEPPKHAIIIILVENLASLLPTIVSRCQIIRIPPLSTQEIGEIIKSRVEVTHDKALVFAKLAQGNPGRGLELALSEEYQQMRDESLELLMKLAKSSTAQAMECVDYFLDKRDNAIEILDMIELWLRDVLVLKQGNLRQIIVNIDKISYLEDLANSFTSRNIQCIIDNIEKSKRMLASHANFQLTIENLLMKIQGSGEYARSSRSTV